MKKKKSPITERDIFFMIRALRLAEKARGMTSPNPLVGAVIVRNGRIIAEDYHKKAGGLHAEALALQKAGNKASGAALYITLEPCCHTDKRTPPCCPAIIKAGIKKVFVAMRDPNTKVSGSGISMLREHGLTVVEGLMEEEAKKLNEVYSKFIVTRRPFVILKAAMTLDGKIATPEGESKWITGEKARNIVHKMRCCVDAVMTAAGTVKADNPELTSRVKCSRQPLRIIIDPDLETPIDYKVCSVPPSSLFVTRHGNEDKKKAMREKGIEILEFDARKSDLRWLMERLGSMGITSVMIEAGSSFNASALMSGVVDKAVFFIAPRIICGKASIPVVGGESFLKLADSINLSDVSMRKVGDDIMVVGYLSRNSNQ
jgi:diaminohydroxyphosphoribosylaminopyrimidine deaminase / 5-amino-6-(5-phosphoribosylamino)uracil reductase